MDVFLVKHDRVCDGIFPYVRLRPGRKYLRQENGLAVAIPTATVNSTKICPNGMDIRGWKSACWILCPGVSGDSTTVAIKQLSWKGTNFSIVLGPNDQPEAQG